MGRRLSLGDETKNIKQLGDFRSYWSQSPGYPEENLGNNVILIPVDVHYEWANGRSAIDFATTLRAFVGSGPDDGTVDLEDTAKVDIQSFHLRFMPVFQTYTYDTGQKALIVEDTSDKMGGRYRVTIIPALEEPL